MSKTYKSLSHYERMNNPKCTCDVKLKRTEHYEYIKERKVDDITGRVYYKTKKQLVSNDKIKKFKVSDFCLENLQAIGALDKMHPVSLSPDVHTVISSVESSLQAISANEINNQSNQTN